MLLLSALETVADPAKRLLDLVNPLPFPHAHADHGLHLALERLGSNRLELLPVVSRANAHQLPGIVTCAMCCSRMASETNPERAVAHRRVIARRLFRILQKFSGRAPHLFADTTVLVTTDHDDHACNCELQLRVRLQAEENQL